MSIQELLEKFKALLTGTDLYIALLLVLVGVASFGLGRLSVSSEMAEEAPRGRAVLVESSAAKSAAVSEGETAPDTLNTDTEEGNYVASKNGTKYHLPWCPGAQQMNEENKVWFATKEEAEMAGYTPAANCKGL